MIHEFTRTNTSARVGSRRISNSANKPLSTVSGVNLVQCGRTTLAHCGKLQRFTNLRRVIPTPLAFLTICMRDRDRYRFSFTQLNLRYDENVSQFAFMTL